MENKSFTKQSTFQTILLVLSVYVVIELYVSTIVTYSDEVQLLLSRIDFGICLLFLFDFFYGIYHAENKWGYFKVYWIDLLSSIPTLDVLRAGRVFRVVRVLRVIRSAKYIFEFFTKKNSFSTFRNLMLAGVLIISLFSLSFYQLEKATNPHINSLSDSLWWTTITTITVGFLQDIPPATVEGKFLSVALILLGMVMFSTLTGTITDYFIEDEDIQDNIASLKVQITTLEDKIDRLTEKIDRLKP